MNANDAETLKDTDFAPKYKKKVINIEENIKTDTNYSNTRTIRLFSVLMPRMSSMDMSVTMR